jgi:DNA replication protein DnaC
MKGVLGTLNQRLKEADEQELSYEDFLNVIFEDEKLHRENDRVGRLLKRAALQQRASLEAFETSPSRGVDKKMLNNLLLMRFVQNGQNIILSGPTGVGKSYLACAIGNNVCRNGFTTQYFRMNTLVEKFNLERAKGTYLNFIKREISIM